jgi:uncharacterized protein (TIGR01244 family)
MEKQIEINDKITSAGQPTRDELKKLPHQGFKSIINLRANGEDDQPLSPEEEGQMANEFGMRYVNIPVSVQEGPKSEQVDRFRKEVEHLPGPVLVHCNKGKRSGAFSLMHIAVKEGMTAESAYKKAESMGYECDSPQLKLFFMDYIEKHSVSH